MTEKCTEDNMKKIRKKHDKQVTIAGTCMLFVLFKGYFYRKKIQRGVFELYQHQRSSIQLWRGNFLLLQKLAESWESAMIIGSKNRV